MHYADPVHHTGIDTYFHLHDYILQVVTIASEFAFLEACLPSQSTARDTATDAKRDITECQIMRFKFNTS